MLYENQNNKILHHKHESDLKMYTQTDYSLHIYGMVYMHPNKDKHKQNQESNYGCSMSILQKKTTTLEKNFPCLAQLW